MQAFIDELADVLLDSWAGYDWRDGVQIDRLDDLDVLEVHTINSQYRITVISGERGEILVTGGRFFPTPTRVRLNGCTLDGAAIKLRGVYPGFRLELQLGARLIRTSRILHVVLLDPRADLVSTGFH